MVGIPVVGVRGFEGAEEKGCWQRFVSPEFYSETAVLPSHVKHLILWSVKRNRFAKVEQFAPSETGLRLPSS